MARNGQREKEFTQLVYLTLMDNLTDDQYGKLKRMFTGIRQIPVGVAQNLNKLEFPDKLKGLGLLSEMNLRPLKEALIDIKEVDLVSLISEYEVKYGLATDHLAGGDQSTAQYQSSGRSQPKHPGKDLSDDKLFDISHDLGSNWERVGLKLGMKQSDMDRARAMYPYDITKQAHTLLVQWRMKTPGDQNKCGLLAIALEEAGLVEIAEKYGLRQGSKSRFFNLGNLLDFRDVEHAAQFSDDYHYGTQPQQQATATQQSGYTVQPQQPLQLQPTEHYGQWATQHQSQPTQYSQQPASQQQSQPPYNSQHPPQQPASQQQSQPTHCGQHPLPQPLPSQPQTQTGGQWSPQQAHPVPQDPLHPGQAYQGQGPAQPPAAAHGQYPSQPQASVTQYSSPGQNKRTVGNIPSWFTKLLSTVEAKFDEGDLPKIKIQAQAFGFEHGELSRIKSLVDLFLEMQQRNLLGPDKLEPLKTMFTNSGARMTHIVNHIEKVEREHCLT